MKILFLKLGVIQIQWWSVIFILSTIGFGVAQNFVTFTDSENGRNRNNAGRGPHLKAGAVPLPFPPLGEQVPPDPLTGIKQNFVRIDSNRGRFNKSFSKNNESPSSSGQQSLIKPHLLINMGFSPAKNDSRKYIRVTNTGLTDELIQITVLDSKGHSMHIVPSQFPLGRGVTAEIPFSMPTTSQRPYQRQNLVIHPLGRSTPGGGGSTSANSNSPSSLSDLTPSSSELITVLARGKRDSVQRSFVFGDPYDGVNYNLEPFCVDKDVTGTCRYRDDPVDCFRWDWTAYATILNNFGPDYKITSLPEGLFVSPGEHGRVRVYLKFSCCTPIVQFVLTDTLSHAAIKSCVVDVRELQHLHPGEIAGIVVAAVLLVLIIIAVIIFCARKRRKETINNVAMIPRLRSRTRSKSTKRDMEVISRQ